MVWPAVAAGVGAAADIGSTFLQAAMNEKQQRRAQRFAKKMYQHRYQYSMEDMRKAGLNPILVASGGLAGSSPASPAIPVGRGDVAGAAGKAASAVQQISLQRELAKQAQAETRLKDAQARQAKATADAIDKYGMAATSTPLRYIDTILHGIRQLPGDEEINKKLEMSIFGIGGHKASPQQRKARAKRKATTRGPRGQKLIRPTLGY